MPRSNLYQALRPQLDVGWRVAAYLGHDGDHGRNVVSVEGRGDDPPATPPLLPLVEKHGRGKAQLLCGPLELRLFSRVLFCFFGREGGHVARTAAGQRCMGNARKIRTQEAGQRPKYRPVFFTHRKRSCPQY